MAARWCPRRHPPPLAPTYGGWHRRPLFLLVLLTASIGASLAGAHPGGLDSSGCHHNRKTGDYHCHRAPPTPSNPPTTPSRIAPLAAPESPRGVVKKSRTGICHGPSSRYYAQTLHFTAFDSLEACLSSGGRLPR